MRILILIFIVICLLSCQQKTSFTKSEYELFSTIGFDSQVFKELKTNIKVEFNQFENSNEGFLCSSDGKIQKTGIEKQNGVSLSIQSDKAQDIVFEFKDDLLKNGYLIFISEKGCDIPSEISIIKSFDKFDILRIQKTRGLKYGIENENIINKLVEWDTKYGIEIIGADYDWVEFIIKSNPEKNPDLATEITKICPQVANFGNNRLKKMDKNINDSRLLFFIWQ